MKFTANNEIHLQCLIARPTYLTFNLSTFIKLVNLINLITSSTFITLSNLHHPTHQPRNHLARSHSRHHNPIVHFQARSGLL